MRPFATFLRASVPVLLLFVLAIPVTKFAHGVLGPETALKLFYAFAAVMLLVITIAAVNYWRWETAKGPVCRHCGGPLSWMTWPGKKMYGKQLSDYRNCWSCGRANGVD